MDINLSHYQDIYERELFSKNGLKDSDLPRLKGKYGENILPKKKRKSLLRKIFSALFEPMILILLFAWIITLGVNVGNILSGAESDFYECIGILGAITLSVGLTIIMESKSERAFETLEKFSDAIFVTVLRDNEKKVIHYSNVLVGDILFCDAGDKIIADGIILEGDEVECEQSMLSGEVEPIKKMPFNGGKIKSENMLFSGAYLLNGNAKVLVLAVGKDAQMGKIANSLQQENTQTAPLTLKLNKLSKKISIFGATAAVLTFLLTIIRLYFLNNLTFLTVKEAFVSAIVLIVAAVPEGLPATVAIALALSVVKLAKSNAVIKKLIAAETVGCVSVICSDKTGTLTIGKMCAQKFVTTNGEYQPENLKNEWIIKNVIYNSTASFVIEKGKTVAYGDSTERALINALFLKSTKLLSKERDKLKIIQRESFNSKRKYMSTTTIQKGEKVTYYKGSIEKIFEICSICQKDNNYFYEEANRYALQADRVIAFAHKIGEKCVFDGFCVITDEVRSEVFNAVKSCKKAGISVKILTGDNKNTAIAIAKKLTLPHDFSNVLTGAECAEMSDSDLIELLPKITVIARSTPETKLRVVKLLKGMGEVVAVTGDGVNDAPAVKNADIGISMGDGSEITKQASDIILLDNSFSVIVKAVAFGRNIYRDFQRFLFFQLTVNFSAVGIIIAFLALGFEPPFSTLQLLWINVIMDGPLALSLGLERREQDYMEHSPVKRTDSIVTKKMFVRIILHSALIVLTVTLQKQYNFLALNSAQMQSAIFSIFILFQLFNAINAREIGSLSIFKSFFKNKTFSLLLILTLVMQIIISEYFCKFFSTVPLGFIGWAKIFLISSAIIILSEIYKCFYRRIKKVNFFKKIIKRGKFA